MASVCRGWIKAWVIIHRGGPQLGGGPYYFSMAQKEHLIYYDITTCHVAKTQSNTCLTGASHVVVILQGKIHGTM